MVKKNGDIILFKVVIGLLIMFSSYSVFSVTQEEILSKLELGKNESVENFVSNMEGVYEMSKEYISQKKMECAGEFSSIVIDDKGEERFKKKKLSKKERNICQLALIHFQVKFVKAAHKIRILHLSKVHEFEIESIKNLYEGELLGLTKMAKKLN